MQPIHRMIKAGDAAGLRKLLQAEAAPKSLANEVDRFGCSPLYNAVSRVDADPEVVKLLIDAGADVHFEPPKDTDGTVFSPHRRPLIQMALKSGDLDIVMLLANHGADLAYIDENGYTAALDAAHAHVENVSLIRYLVGLGLELNHPSKYRETAVRSASRLGRFKCVAELVKAGVDEKDLGWTPLIRAVAIGDFADVERELLNSPQLDSQEVWGRNAMHVAMQKGDLQVASLLLASGLNISLRAKNGTESICFAVQSGDPSFVEWVVGQGCSVEGKDFMGVTALARAVRRGDVEMVRTLLSLGADPNSIGKYLTAPRGIKGRETLLTLLDHGADQSHLSLGGRLQAAGLETEGPDALDEVSKKEYRAHRYPREGTKNPENIASPFLVAMVRAGCNALQAREHFDDVPSSIRRTERPVWCFERFGQSFTMLPDGRSVLIAGEHEDYHDPDFYIYNDVVVIDPAGEIRIYGYPFSVFPATDFHSATLVGDDIYMIGSLGYLGSRQGDIPVYRLSTTDFHIEPIPTTGAVPPRIYGHFAKLVDGRKIRIEGGKKIVFKDAKERHVPNKKAFELDLATLSWSRG